MERIISPGASLSSIKGRRHRLYRIEKDDELEGDFGISATNEGEVKVKKKPRSQKDDKWLFGCLDEIILMKILPRLNGNWESSQKIINDLLRFTRNKYQRSFKRLSYMKNRAEEFHFVSFWG